MGVARLRRLGYRSVIFPISTLLAATAGMRGILQEIATAGTPSAVLRDVPNFGELTDFIGVPQGPEVEQRYPPQGHGPGRQAEGGGRDCGDGLPDNAVHRAC